MLNSSYTNVVATVAINSHWGKLLPPRFQVPDGCQPLRGQFDALLQLIVTICYDFDITI